MVAHTRSFVSYLRSCVIFICSLPGLALRSLGKVFWNRGGQQAAILSYYTLFGLVPLVIAVMLTFQLFPAYENIGQTILDLVYEQMNFTGLEVQMDANDPQTRGQLTDRINAMVEETFAHFDRRIVTIVSIGLSVLAALGIAVSIERGFNRIWQAKGRRPFIVRLINYWVLLTLGPILLALDIYLLSHYQASELLRTWAWMEPYLLIFGGTLIGLFVLYYILPKGDVQAASSFVAAFMTTVLLGLAIWGGTTAFRLYLPQTQHRVYGFLGLLPLGILAIFMMWLIILYGAQYAYGMQCLSERLFHPRRTKGKFMVNELTVINILREISTKYSETMKPVPEKVIFQTLSIPNGMGGQVLTYLTQAGYLALAHEPVQGYIPLKQSKDIQLSDIAGICARASIGQEGPAYTLQDHPTMGQQSPKALEPIPFDDNDVEEVTPDKDDYKRDLSD